MMQQTLVKLGVKHFKAESCSHSRRHQNWHFILVYMLVLCANALLCSSLQTSYTNG